MELFVTYITSYPTAIYTVLLVVVTVYWLVAMVGLLDIDMFDMDVDADMDADVEMGENSDGPAGLAGLLLKLKLDGVPVTVSISILILMSWLASYFIVYFTSLILPLDNTLIKITVGSIIFIASLFVASPATAFLIKPLKPFFKKANSHTELSLIGSTGRVRTSRVTQNFGEAVVDTGSTELILRIRADESLGFTVNDRVVLLDYIKNDNAYQVVSENEFHGNN